MEKNPRKRRRLMPKDGESDIWNVKSFKTKKDLDNYIKVQGFKYRSSEEKTTKQRCRFCLALNPNSSQHMIQVYLNCRECLKTVNCLKTNICVIQNKYELLNKHKNLCPKEWKIFYDEIQSDAIEVNTDDELSFGDELSDIFFKMSINNRIENEYYTNARLEGNFYVWVVKDVFPSQRYLFKEVFLVKIKEVWIEFRNGRQKHKFRGIPNSEKIILHRDDDSMFELNSKQLYNYSEESIEYEGEWITDPNKQNPCIECSNEINKMVFDCDQHKIGLIDSSKTKDLNRVWKANLKYDLKYFRRKNIDIWEEYCNNECTDKFKFIKFDENSDLIIQRVSTENPDYLRFTERELFIGNVKDYIYYPLYTGEWQIESEFTQKLIKENKKMGNGNSLTIDNIKKYLGLLNNFLQRQNIQIMGLEDPIFLRFEESPKINKYEEFARIIQTGKAQYAFCTGNLKFGLTGKNLYIFDASQRVDIDENLMNQIKKFKETINPHFVKINHENSNLSGYYSFALMTAYVMNQICSLFDLQNLNFDELKLVDHFVDCLNKEEISMFPTINYSGEEFSGFSFSPFYDIDSISVQSIVD